MEEREKREEKEKINGGVRKKGEGETKKEGRGGQKRTRRTKKGGVKEK